MSFVSLLKITLKTFYVSVYQKGLNSTFKYLILCKTIKEDIIVLITRFQQVTHLSRYVLRSARTKTVFFNLLMCWHGHLILLYLGELVIFNANIDSLTLSTLCLKWVKNRKCSLLAFWKAVTSEKFDMYMR